MPHSHKVKIPLWFDAIANKTAKFKKNMTVSNNRQFVSFTAETITRKKNFCTRNALICKSLQYEKKSFFY